MVIQMKMKRIMVTILSFALVGAVVAGCGESQQARQDTQQDVPQSISQETQQDTIEDKTGEETVEKETAEETVQTIAGYEDNFAVDGKAAKEFAEKVKDAAANKDLEALAELTAFPVYVGLLDVDVVETKEDFLKLGSENVFTEALLKSIEMADIEDLQPSMAGFSISDGSSANINFGVVDGVLAINGINY